MYIHFVYLFIKKEKMKYVNQFCVGYFKLTNIQHICHQHQFICDNDVRQGGIFLSLLLLE
jgi:hypothetical protein